MLLLLTLSQELKIPNLPERRFNEAKAFSNFRNNWYSKHCVIQPNKHCDLCASCLHGFVPEDPLQALGKLLTNLNCITEPAGAILTQPQKSANHLVNE